MTIMPTIIKTKPVANEDRFIFIEIILEDLLLHLCQRHYSLHQLEVLGEALMLSDSN